MWTLTSQKWAESKWCLQYNFFRNTEFLRFTDFVYCCMLHNSDIVWWITVGQVLNVILLIVKYEFFYTRRNQKNHRICNEYYMWPHPFRSSLHAWALAIANMHAFSISSIFDLLAYIYVQLLIVENESSSFDASSQLSTCQSSTGSSSMVFY